MRLLLHRSPLLLAAALLACEPASSAPPTIDVVQGQTAETTAANKPAIAVAKCSAAALAEVLRGLGQVVAADRGAALAGGLLVLCGSAVDPVVAEVFGRVYKHAPEPSDVGRLPESVFEVVDLSAEDSELRKAFASAYVRLLADMRHRLSGWIDLPALADGSDPRDDDVEVTLRRKQRHFEGRPIPDEATLASVLPPASSGRRFVAVLDEEHASGQLYAVLRQAREAGFSDLGVLVGRDGVYRVVTLRIGTSADAFGFPLSVRAKGLYFTHDEDPKPRVSASGVGFIGRAGDPKPLHVDVPALGVGSGLDNDARWDFDALAQALPAKLVTIGRRVTIGLKVDPRVTTASLLRLVVLLSKATCDKQPKSQCGVAGVVWLP